MADLTEYELERERRIASNREMLAKLQLPALAASVSASPAAHTYQQAARTPEDLELSEARRLAAKRKREEEEARYFLARRSLRAKGIGPLAETDEEVELRIQWAEEARVEGEKRKIEREEALAAARARGEAVATRGGRPVTWIGGGGQDPHELTTMGVPELRARFLQVFGQHTASNNSTWLRKKLAEPIVGTGPVRASQPRSRDLHANIWTKGELPAGLPGARTVDDMMELLTEEERIQYRAAEAEARAEELELELRGGVGEAPVYSMAAPPPPAAKSPGWSPGTPAELPVCKYRCKCPLINSAAHRALFQHPSKDPAPTGQSSGLGREASVDEAEASSDGPSKLKKARKSEERAPLPQLAPQELLALAPPPRKAATAASQAMKKASKPQVVPKTELKPVEKVKSTEKAKGKKAAARLEEEEEEEEEDEEGGAVANGILAGHWEQLYCLCRAPDDGQFMIGCDSCDGWYHPGCVGLSVKKVQRWTDSHVYECPVCEEKTRRAKARAEKAAASAAQKAAAAAAEAAAKARNREKSAARKASRAAEPPPAPSGADAVAVPRETLTEKRLRQRQQKQLELEHSSARTLLLTPASAPEAGVEPGRALAEVCAAPVAPLPATSELLAQAVGSADQEEEPQGREPALDAPVACIVPATSAGEEGVDGVDAGAQGSMVAPDPPREVVMEGAAVAEEAPILASTTEHEQVYGVEGVPENMSQAMPTVASSEEPAASQAVHVPEARTQAAVEGARWATHAHSARDAAVENAPVDMGRSLNVTAEERSNDAMEICDRQLAPYPTAERGDVAEPAVGGTAGSDVVSVVEEPAAGNALMTFGMQEQAAGDMADLAAAAEQAARDMADPGVEGATAEQAAAAARCEEAETGATVGQAASGTIASGVAVASEQAGACEEAGGEAAADLGAEAVASEQAGACEEAGGEAAADLSAEAVASEQAGAFGTVVQVTAGAQLSDGPHINDHPTKAVPDTDIEMAENDNGVPAVMAASRLPDALCQNRSQEELTSVGAEVVEEDVDMEQAPPEVEMAAGEVEERSLNDPSTIPDASGTAVSASGDPREDAAQQDVAKLGGSEASRSSMGFDDGHT
ncbi:hypothetical protein CYMTET_50439 [Cymbomonas tetramitiformis]|uniref:PHD-type domain-containing protein n=1 Tax=Cymbomonas tetramitiformis TaxID=36881 RepID=A0AAE0ET52_9CHLO|nr:hypothetical protein CYMTET_50439 [Cymbomonas tetramitiformis]